jgi:hypothetical protein
MRRTTGPAASPRWQIADEDFDAYAEGRARATTMTAPRAAVKRRLVAWMHAVAERLADEGIDLEESASDEHPSARNGHRVDAQSVFLFRTEAPTPAARDELQPETGHARLELRLDAAAVALFLRLGGDARVDLEHAAALLGLEPEDVTVAWEGLPEGLGIEARGSLSPRARAIHETGPRDAGHMAKQALESDVPVVIGLRLPRAEATAAGALDGWLDAALALGRLLDVLAWSPEGAAWAAARMSERRSSSRGRLESARRGKHSPARSPAAAPAGADSPPKTIEPGVHVRALAGPFAGQAGIVQELDGKGGARVLFGLLAARVELRDLVVKGKERGRPLLSSSHRKPTT